MAEPMKRSQCGHKVPSNVYCVECEIVWVEMMKDIAERQIAGYDLRLEKLNAILLKKHEQQPTL